MYTSAHALPAGQVNWLLRALYMQEVIDKILPDIPVSLSGQLMKDIQDSFIFRTNTLHVVYNEFAFKTTLLNKYYQILRNISILSGCSVLSLL